MDLASIPQEPYKPFEPFEDMDGPIVLRCMYFIQFEPLLMQGFPMPDEFAEVLEFIDINTPLKPEEANQFALREQFMATVDQYRELLAGQKSEDFHVTNEFTDEYGYPNTSKMPILYTFLWNNNPDLFDANNNYWWAKPAEDVMYICSEYYRYIKWMEKEEEDFKKD